MNGDAIFDFNIEKIFNEHELKKDQTYIGCENELAYGTVSLQDKKIVSFDRNITFNSVKRKNKPKLVAYVYSGMAF